jgi:hypothetical protein
MKGACRSRWCASSVDGYTFLKPETWGVEVDRRNIAGFDIGQHLNFVACALITYKEGVSAWP